MKKFDEICKKNFAKKLNDEFKRNQKWVNKVPNNANNSATLNLSDNYDKTISEIIHSVPKYRKLIKSLKDLGVETDLVKSKIGEKVDAYVMYYLKHTLSKKYLIYNFKFSDGVLDYKINYQSEVVFPVLHKICKKLDNEGLLYYYKYNDCIYVLHNGKNYLSITEKPHNEHVKLIVGIVCDYTDGWFNDGRIKVSTIKTKEENKLVDKVQEIVKPYLKD